MYLVGIITRTLIAFQAPAPHAAPKPVPVATVPATPAIVTSVPVVAAPAATAAVTAATALDNVQKFYGSIKQVTALFRQTVTNDTFGSTKSSDGTVYIMKPGKMRWEYAEKKKGVSKVEKSFISNGQTLHVVDHGNMQVLTKSLEKDLMPVAVSFLYGKGDLKTEFTPTLDTSGKYAEKKGDIVLKLTPKKSSAQYKSLILVVAPTDFHVTQSVIIDSSNNINHFRFYSPDFVKPIDAKWFEFDRSSLKNYRFIDADNQGATKAPAKAAPAPAPAPAPAKPVTPAPPAKK
ncbi:MAG TPA: outer membrane lipoprotein carrier protein LolA [Kofleriaceae bacterium]